jgi:hypothetical protein
MRTVIPARQTEETASSILLNRDLLVALTIVLLKKPAAGEM